MATDGSLRAVFDFHGIGFGVEAPASLQPIFQECERFWSYYKAENIADEALTIVLHAEDDWAPWERYREVQGNIFIGPLRWYYQEDGSFVLHEPERVVLGSARRIDAYLPAGVIPDDPRLFVHFMLNLAFIEALRHHGLYYVHGACLQSPEGKRYLIAGDGRQGKSTLATGLLLDGYSYLSDDAVFFDTRNDAHQVLGYHKHFHVGDDLIARFTHRISPSAFMPYGKTNKSEIDPEALFPGKRLQSLPAIDVILMPSIIDAPTTLIEPTPLADVLSNFFTASTQVFFDRNLAAKHLAALRQMTHAARGYRFQAGRDVYANPALYHPLIQGL
jgi:hypothetical protein